MQTKIDGIKHDITKFLLLVLFRTFTVFGQDLFSFFAGIWGPDVSAAMNKNTLPKLSHIVSIPQNH